jgi:hypothetical protein
MNDPGLLNKCQSKMRNIFAYTALLWRNPHVLFPLIAKTSFSQFEKTLNRALLGYPSNHNYFIYNRRIFPKFQLFERFQLVTSLFPEKLKSLLDIGSCRGFYSHRGILSRLAKICSDRVIFSARLETHRLPKSIRSRAEMNKDKYAYHTHGFLECAREYFDIHEAGYLGRYPLLLMAKKGPQ